MLISYSDHGMSVCLRHGATAEFIDAKCASSSIAIAYSIAAGIPRMCRGQNNDKGINVLTQHNRRPVSHSNSSIISIKPKLKTYHY